MNFKLLLLIRIKHFVCLITLGINLWIYSQDPAFVNYNSKDGLPSSETYDIYQDSLGFIWISTDRGLSRFDGKNFINYTPENGLPSHVIFDFFEESKTKVWFSTKEGKLYYFNPINYPIHFDAFDLNDQLKQETDALHLNTNIKQFRHIDNHYYIGFDNSSGYLKISESGIAELVGGYKKHDNTPVTDIIVSSEINYTKVNTKSNNRLNFYDEYNKKRYSIINPYNQLRGFNVSKSVHQNQNLIILYYDIILKSVGDSIIYKKLDAFGLDLIVLDEKIIVATYNGIHEFDFGLNKVKTYLLGSVVSSLYVDAENALWITTTDKGIFYIKNHKIKSITYNGQQLKVRYIFSQDNYTFLLTGNGQLYVYNQSGRFLYHSPYTASYTTVGSVMDSPDKMLQRYFSHREKHKHTSNKYSYHLTDAPFYVSFGGEYLYSCSPDTVFTRHELLFKVSESLFMSDTILLATNIGLLASISPDIYFNYLPNSELFSQPLKHLKRIGNHFITSTEDSGLIIFKDSIISEINISNGLLDNYISDICIENDTTVWIASYKGLNKIVFSDKIYKNFTVQNITSEEGLISNEITDVDVSGNNVWVCTKYGTHLFESNTSFPSSKSTFHIDSILINDNRLKLIPDSITYLNYGENLNLFYTVIRFANETNYKIQYTMSADTSLLWLPTNENHILLSNLSPGKHNLKVKIKNQDKVLFEHIIFVPVPYWQTWYFITGISIIIIILLILLIKVSIKINNKRKQREIDKVKLEIKALTSQMNPHFTFNTINSIQHYLIQNDKIGGIQYLSDYAKLMRLSLNHSRNEFITIEEELKFLKLYCELEKKRFEKEFDVNFDIRIQSVPHQIYLPSLLLQPLIENAIIHGVNSINENGEINVSMTETNNYLEIEVSDNGIGILNNKTIDINKSFGLNILKDRLKIYNGKEHSNLLVKFTYLNEKQKTGTKINFKLSLKSYEGHNN